MSSDYTPKAGDGTLFENKNRQSANAPTHRGNLILPDGSVIGLAVWVKETRAGGTLYSLKIDDREGEFQARKLGRPQTTMADSAPRNHARVAGPYGQRADEWPADDDDEIPF